MWLILGEELLRQRTIIRTTRGVGVIRIIQQVRTVTAPAAAVLVQGSGQARLLQLLQWQLLLVLVPRIAERHKARPVPHPVIAMRTLTLECRECR